MSNNFKEKEEAKFYKGLIKKASQNLRNKWNRHNFSKGEYRQSRKRIFDKIIEKEIRDQLLNLQKYNKMKALTAEEFLVRDELFKTPLTEEEKHYYIDRIITYDDYIKGMIEFAKMHVQEALKQALESIPCLGSSTDIASYEEVEEAILNAYPLKNII